MTSEMDWTTETYRLDEVEGKFDFPCVIRVNEGFYSATDAEGFSQGDILSIDSKMVLHKVAANFTDCADLNTKGSLDEDYVELKNEILVPLNYKGKLKVIRTAKYYDNVKDLTADFPRYATVRKQLDVTTEEDKIITIKSGTTIELDRIIPGPIVGSKRQPGKLVVRFQHSSGPLNVALSMHASGKFITEPDNNEYTIKEALDRYSLPQHVRFVDDKLKRVYTQDLLEGIENMNIITETLRLNRLVTQTVLVGHYKPLDGNVSNDTERFRQRTLAVLPMNKPEICEIEVNVSKCVTDDIYEQVFLVRNVSHSNTEEIVDGSLYVDFAMTPGIKLISQEEDVNYDDTPPPRPPKPSNIAPEIGPKPVSRVKQKKKALSLDSSNTVVKKDIKDDDDDGDEDGEGDYIFPKARAVSESDNISGFNLADLDFKGSETATNSSTLRKKIYKKVATNISNLKSSFKNLTTSRDKRESIDCKTKLESSAQFIPEDSNASQESDNLYSDINEDTMLEACSQKSPVSKTLDGGKYDDTYLGAIKYKEESDKPMALVQPVRSHHKGKVKAFKDLNNTELVDRLRQCGLKEMSDFCHREMLNGSFFNDISTETLQKDLNLKGIQLTKFVQMRDANWVPR